MLAMKTAQQRHPGKMMPGRINEKLAQEESENLVVDASSDESEWAIPAHKAGDLSSTSTVWKRAQQAIVHAAPLLYLTATSTMITLIAQIFNDQACLDISQLR